MRPRAARLSVDLPVSFGDRVRVQRAFGPVYEALDHRFLNDVPGLENPTSEHLAVWIWSHLRPTLTELSAVEITETGASGVVYRG